MKWMIVGLMLMTSISAGAQAAVKPVEIVAHRGESYLAPENTLAAINLAWKLGADAVEIDIYLTSDGQPVICHDATTKRTAGVDLAIKSTPAARLRELDVGSWKDKRFAGEKMPLLEEALATVPDGKRMLIEVKCGPEAVPALRKAILASGKKPVQCVIISFNARVIEEAKRVLPEHKALLLAGQKQKDGQWSPTVGQLIETARQVHADGISVSAQPSVDSAFVAAARSAGLEFHVWTVDSPEQAKTLIKYKIDSLTTNRAAWLKEQI